MKIIQRCMYTQRNLFQILLNQTDIRLYLRCTDRFGSNRTSAWFQIIRKMVNTIWFRFDLIRFRKDFSVRSGMKYDGTCYFIILFDSQFQINRKMVNTIWFRFDLKRFRKDFSVSTIIFNSALLLLPTPPSAQGWGRNFIKSFS